MWTSLASVTLGLSCTTQMLSVASRTYLPRQEQCASAPNDAGYAACAMQAALRGSSIIPQLLPKFTPQAALAVKYGNVVLGGAQQLSPSRVFAQPSLSMSFISDNAQAYQKPYIVMGLSYQAPSNVKVFWLQPDLKVDRTTGVMSTTTPPIVPYMSPNPASGTGANEFIFFIFPDLGLEELTKQNPQWAAQSTVALDVKTFASTISPQVIAASYFKTSYDGILINSQTPSVLSDRQASKVLQVATPPTNVTSKVIVPTQPNGKQNSTALAPSAKIGAATNQTNSTPTQVLRPVVNADEDSNQTSSTSSFIRENSLKSLLAVALSSITLC